MGKRKINTQKKIEDTPTRIITLRKRKKGLIKKAMELSFLCDQDIMLVLWNKELN